MLYLKRIGKLMLGVLFMFLSVVALAIWAPIFCFSLPIFYVTSGDFLESLDRGMNLLLDPILWLEHKLNLDL